MPPRPRQPLGLLHHVDALVEKLRETIPLALEDGDPDAIHVARVTTRRLRAAVDLLEPLGDRDEALRFRRTLRRLRRRLGPIRDIDVMIGHLRRMPSSRSHGHSVRWLLERLASARTKAGDDARAKSPLHKVLGKLGSWWGLREHIVGAEARIDAMLGESLHAQLDAFSTQASRLVAAHEGQQVGDEPVDAHAIRIAGKALRYTLEMARAAGHELPGAVMKSFKKMQDALGLWHDFVVLTERSLELSSRAQLAHHDGAAQRAVLALAQSSLRRSENQLARFAELWKDSGAAVHDAIASAFAGAVNEPKTDHGPADLPPISPQEAAALDDPAAA
ncbi:MAG: CHAD domain-containing protein [Tepidisphaeraceae bacterium]